MKATLKIILLLIMFAPVQSLAAEQRINIPLGDSPQLGPNNAPITIIEFLDFQ